MNQKAKASTGTILQTHKNKFIILTESSEISKTVVGHSAIMAHTELHQKVFVCLSACSLLSRS
jgi:hypothetical protein